ncbi:glycosyltransferase family 2 protein [Labrys neptuniae]
MWRVQEEDPHFIIRPGRWPTKYLLIEIVSPEFTLDPCLYFDTGYGFNAQQMLALDDTRHTLYALEIAGLRGLSRVRFDPCSYHRDRQGEPVTFTVRVTGGRSLRRIRAQRPADSCTLQLIDAKVLSGSSFIRRPMPPDEYFKSIARVAERDIASRPPRSIPADLLSFVTPVYNTRTDYLDCLLQSFLAQHAENWELLLCDDGSTNQETLAWLDRQRAHPRIKVLRNQQNGGIASATNLGLFAASGEWIGFIDHDDALAPFALDYLYDTIAEHPQAAFIYTDEVITDSNLKPNSYFFKPAFDPVLLSGVNYINHLSLYRRERLVEIGGLRLGYDGSQDYELVLRYLAGLPSKAIVHLPYPAYMWRRHVKSYSASFTDMAVTNARRALGAAYRDGNTDCPVGQALVADLHRVHLEKRRKTWPLVSVIIPNRDSFKLISRILEDLTQRTDYPALEIIVIDNGTTDPAVIDLYERYQRSHPNFRVDLFVEPFNFARQINRGLQTARGEGLLLLNNDIEIQDHSWLKEMVGCLDYPDAGIVGARLLYPTGKLQHAGVIVGLGGLAGHWFGNAAATTSGPMGRLRVRQSFSAVTGACMLISRRCYEATGDFDEQSFAIAYNDIDYCLRAAAAGFRTVWTPFATLVHHESATRGSDETEENRPRFEREKARLRRKYRTDIMADPAFSLWYSNEFSTPREVIPRKIPSARFWSALLAHEPLTDDAGPIPLGRTGTPDQGTARGTP